MTYEPQTRRPEEWRLVVGQDVELSYEPQPSRQADWRLFADLEVVLSYEFQHRRIEIGCRFGSGREL